MIFSVVLLCYFFIASAQDSPTNQAYLFAADAETLLYSNLVASFSCQGRDYGYYADVPNNCQVSTVFENHRKSLIQHRERSELSLHFEWTKVN